MYLTRFCDWKMTLWWQLEIKILALFFKEFLNRIITQNCARCYVATAVVKFLCSKVTFPAQFMNDRLVSTKQIVSGIKENELSCPFSSCATLQLLNEVNSINSDIVYTLFDRAHECTIMEKFFTQYCLTRKSVFQASKPQALLSTIIKQFSNKLRSFSDCKRPKELVSRAQQH